MDLPGLSTLPAISRFKMASFFARKDRMARWCVLCAVMSTSCALVALVIAYRALAQQTRIVVLDPSGNVLVLPGKLFHEATELHTEQALLATSALLLRGPNNFDLPELLQSMVVANALNQAAALKANEGSEFQEKQIHQKPLVAHVDALEIRPSGVLMQTSGQLLRTGLFQQQPFSEVLPFVLKLTFRHNPDLLRNRRQPMVVVDFQISYEIPR